MKNLIVIVLSVAALASHGSIAEARANFERPAAEAFARATLLLPEVAPDAWRYDKAPGKAKYVFALPYSDDFRLRLIDATFDGGKFVEAKLAVLGFDPKPLAAKDFEALRETFPMASIRTGSDDVNPIAVLYPARNRKFACTLRDELAESVDPTGHLLGALGFSVRRLGVSLNKMAYRAWITSAQGQKVDCGVISAKRPLNPGVLKAAIREGIEKADPKRKGHVSERDVADFRIGSTVTFEPVAAPKK